MITVQSIVDWARAIPGLVPVLGVAGYGDEPALTIATDVLAEIMSPPSAWKWNRVIPAPFPAIAGQQDYVTSITNVAWLERCDRTETSSTALMKPVREVEAVRDLPLATMQGEADKICWVPNSQAICGTWSAGMAAVVGQQIRDGNGNIQVVTVPGVAGAAQPPWSTAPGTTVADGTITWQCANPLGIAWRLNRVPPQNVNIWSHQPVYQAKPPTLNVLTQSLAPVPDELGFVLRSGFAAHCYRQSSDEAAPKLALMWEARFAAALRTALVGADRELAEFGLVPAVGLMDW